MLSVDDSKTNRRTGSQLQVLYHILRIFNLHLFKLKFPTTMLFYLTETSKSLREFGFMFNMYHHISRSIVNRDKSDSNNTIFRRTIIFYWTVLYFIIDKVLPIWTLNRNNYSVLPWSANTIARTSTIKLRTPVNLIKMQPVI